MGTTPGGTGRGSEGRVQEMFPPEGLVLPSETPGNTHLSGTLSNPRPPSRLPSLLSVCSLLFSFSIRLLSLTPNHHFFLLSPSPCLTRPWHNSHFPQITLVFLNLSPLTASNTLYQPLLPTLYSPKKQCTRPHVFPLLKPWCFQIKILAKK